MHDSTESSPAQVAPRWVLLVHQLPPRPAYLRVRIRRRLTALGAVLLKNTVYALPWSAGALEDFQWLRTEILGAGGEAILFDAAIVAGAADATGGRRRRPTHRRHRLPALAGGRTWATRRDVQVDRIASAWLIRRWIDPHARFRFVAPRGGRPVPRALRFDMFEGEFTHDGDRCTFETLLHRFGLGRDPALRALGEVIHDLDLKDARFRRAEAPRVARLLERVIRSCRTDPGRLRAGARILDQLHRDWSAAAPATPLGRRASSR